MSLCGSCVKVSRVCSVALRPCVSVRVVCESMYTIASLVYVCRMAFFVPLLGFAGSSVLLNYHASQQLEFVGKDARFTRMFWPPFGLGVLLGLWIGVSFAPRILGSIELFETWMAWMFGSSKPKIQQT